MMSEVEAQKVLAAAVDRYVRFQVHAKPVKIPYILGHGRWQFWRTGGKGSAEQIRQELHITAARRGFDLKKASPYEIYNFMRRYRLGIDCSGLAYHVLDEYLRFRKGEALDRHLLRWPGLLGEAEKAIFSYARARRIRAQDLTNELNSFRISDINKIQPGDLIKLTSETDSRPHVAVITKIKRQAGRTSEISYVHSSLDTQRPGPHIAKIKIIDPSLELNEQVWEEKLRSKISYGQICFGKSGQIRRLRCLA